LKNYTIINYGPWDRLNGNAPFVPGFEAKPKGANFYPADMTAEEFEKANLPQGSNPYTIVRRDENGKLYTIPYHEHFKSQIKKAADLLRRAASFADDSGLKKYLNLRADALENDDYFASDIA